MTYNIQKLIINNLSDDLLSSKYKKLKTICTTHKTFGHCYIASEVAYFLLGGKNAGWTAYCMKIDNGNHWFLKHTSGNILDITKEQFDKPINYDLARGKGFLTKILSKRSRILLGRIKGLESKTK